MSIDFTMQNNYHSSTEQVESRLLNANESFDLHMSTVDGALHTEWQTFCDGLLQGLRDRAKESANNPISTGLEIGSSAGVAAGFTLMSKAGGRWGVAAELGAFVLGGVMANDLVRRGSNVYDVYTNSSAISVQGLESRKNAIAKNVGSGLFDYSFMFASGGLAASALQLRPHNLDLNIVKGSEKTNAIGTDRISEIESRLGGGQFKVDFKINTEQLALHTLKTGGKWVGKADQAIIAFQNRAWELDRDSYGYLRNNYLEKSILSASPRDNSVGAQGVWKLLEQMQKDPTFMPILNDTQKALVTLKQEWNSNLLGTQKMMQDLTGLPLNNHVNVYVTNPSLRAGYSYGDGNVVITSRTDFPNYN
ncbi:MAG: hypothetical protein K2X81_05550, partial [Candidatus Obscuribacterales bacterium]|nr:hypothetical protein [Candidatus Obscuribacterales bacterium]